MPYILFDFRMIFSYPSSFIPFLFDLLFIALSALLRFSNYNESNGNKIDSNKRNTKLHLNYQQEEGPLRRKLLVGKTKKLWNTYRVDN